MVYQMKTNKPIRAFYLDVLTNNAQDVIRTLKRYKTTIDVQYDGPYREDPTYVRIYVTTTLTESALESYLYKHKTFEIVGIIETTIR